MNITLVANAGLLISHNNTGLLVDGVYDEEAHNFPAVSPQDLQHMQQGTGLFHHLDYLLFTHEHPDHFSPRMVQELIYHRPVKGLLLPDASKGSKELARLLSHIQRLGIPHWTLGLPPGETKRIDLASDLSITAIGTRHMGPQYQDILNDCFLISWAGKNLLVTGDGDHVGDYYQQAMEGIALDAVFVNPLFYHHPHGQEIIHDIFRPLHVVIYHMPDTQNDSMRLNLMVSRDIKRLKRLGIQNHVLTRENRSFSLPPN